MPSFDMVSKVNEMELQNAIVNAEKVINGRFDFKGSEAKIEYKPKDKIIELRAEDDTKVKALLDILRTSMGKRGIGLKGMKESEIQATGMKMKKMTLTLAAGFDKDTVKVVNRLIKESGFKGKSQYMDEKFRFESKNIDDLQTVFGFLKNHKDLELEVSMENMKR
jgi:uncharacterized protein YajQ (UPF0234 family)